MLVRSIQALSGLAFSSFLSLHALNTIVASTGPHGYDETQRLFRMFYWHPMVELPVLFGALGVHVASSIYLMISRELASQKQQQPPRTKAVATVSWRTLLHRYSGIFLMFCVGGHIFATRGHSVLLPDEHVGGFTLVQYTMDKFPGFWLMYPYYLAFGVCGVVHGVYGVIRSLEVLAPPLRPLMRSLQSGYTIEVVNFVLCLGMIAGVSSFAGLLRGLGPTDEYPAVRKFYAMLMVGPLQSLLP